MKKLAIVSLLLVSVAYAEKFAVGMDVGYGTVSQFYNDDGKATDLSSSLSILNFGLNGKYYILSPEIGPRVYIGGKFNFSNYTSGSLSSGFSPQQLSLFLGGSLLLVNAKVGFQFDLGPKLDIINKKFPNSDRENAILFGGGLNIPFMVGLGDFHVNLDYVFTPPRTENNTTINALDYLFITVGGGYKFGLGELVSLGIGIDVISRNTYGSLSGNQLSIMPYLNYKTGPISAWLKLGVADEYGYYGFSIMGKDDYVTRLGATAGINFSF